MFDEEMDIPAAKNNRLGQPFKQRCGSGHLVPEPKPLVRGADPDTSIIKQNSKKTLIPFVLLLLYDFISLKNDVNVRYLLSKSNKQKKIVFFDVLKVNENSRISGSVPKCHGSAF
jgi:hypothetical protein